ncbi:MAG TPA: Arm DNA-binding domain-containing protein, partial [Steroidobacteraceae bacterium]|nr:Arm DNA-binding domain-containing protein [Steroidobacteraceae bacterium]
MKLTDAIIASATIEPGKTSRALQDGGRLFLRITVEAKQWRLKYQVAPGPKGERMKVLGEYPAVSIDKARELAADVRAAAAKQSAVREVVAASVPVAIAALPTASPDGPTFGEVAAHWLT